MKHPERFYVRAAAGCGALLLAMAAGAQTPALDPVPAPRPTTERATAPETRERTEAPAAADANTPPAVARQQHAEISRGDPARWNRDDADLASRLKTIRKEIAAGLQENLGACRKEPAAQRAACIREARALYQQEMSEARARAAMAE